MKNGDYYAKVIEDMLMNPYDYNTSFDRVMRDLKSKRQRLRKKLKINRQGVPIPLAEAKKIYEQIAMITKYISKYND